MMCMRRCHLQSPASLSSVDRRWLRLITTLPATSAPISSTVKVSRRASAQMTKRPDQAMPENVPGSAQRNPRAIIAVERLVGSWGMTREVLQVYSSLSMLIISDIRHNLR